MVEIGRFVSVFLAVVAGGGGGVGRFVEGSAFARLAGADVVVATVDTREECFVRCRTAFFEAVAAAAIVLAAHNNTTASRQD